MRAWRTLPDERSELFSPIGLLPVDDITGRPPVGALRAFLDALQANGSWRQTDLRPKITRGGVIAYPALGRKRQPLTQPPRRYRVRVEADHAETVAEIRIYLGTPPEVLTGRVAPADAAPVVIFTPVAKI